METFFCGAIGVLLAIFLVFFYCLATRNNDEKLQIVQRDESLSHAVKFMCIDGKKFAMTKVGPNSWNAVQIFDTDRRGNMNVVRCREE